MMTHYFVSNVSKGLNIGARNQALGVAEALARLAGEDGIPAEFVEYDFHQISGLKAALRSGPAGTRPVLITVGDDGVEVLRQVPRALGYQSVLLGHELPRNLDAVKGAVDVLAVPEHVTGADAPGVGRYVRTRGVSHATTGLRVAASLAAWAGRFPGPEGRPSVMAVLGGSVDGRQYDPREAFLLGQFVLQKAAPNGGRIIATSSPRTPPEAVAAFRDATERAAGACVFLPHGSGTLGSPFHAMLGATARDRESCIVLTGDSVSMPCEAASVVPPHQIYIYTVSNQNSNNDSFINWMSNNISVNITRYNSNTGYSVTRPDRGGPILTLDAPVQIARVIRDSLWPLTPPRAQ